MSRRPVRNAPASLHARALNLARERGTQLNFLTGEIPAHWEVRRLGAIGRITKCSGGTKAHEVPEGIPCVRYGDLYTYHGFSIIRSRSFVSAEHAAAYSTIRYGDLLFAASGETINEIGKSSVNLMDGEVLCGGDVILLRPTIPVEARFLGYAANAPYMAHQKAQLGRGMTVMHIYGKQLKNATILLPPLSEQQSIADHLDRKTAKIDAVIGRQHELMERLQEKRTTLISHAVTKGLDPDAPMKDSGIEWLGEIPSHWEVRRLKQCASVSLSNVDKKSVESEARIRLCNYVDVYHNERIEQEMDFMMATASADQIRRFSLKEGDVLITKDSETWTDIAVPAVVDQDLPGVLCGYHLALVRSYSDCVGAFLARVISAIGPRDQYHVAANGITRFGLTADAIRSSVLPIPPTAEQQAIADHLDRETAKIDALTTKITESIDLLTEYRTALISAAVTGKIDVRNHRTDTDSPHPSTDETPA